MNERTIGIAYTVEKMQEGTWVPVPIKVKHGRPVYGTQKRGIAHRVARAIGARARCLITTIQVDEEWYY